MHVFEFALADVDSKICPSQSKNPNQNQNTKKIKKYAHSEYEQWRLEINAFRNNMFHI